MGCSIVDGDIYITKALMGWLTDEVFGAVQEVTGDIFISDNRRLNDVSALFKGLRKIGGSLSIEKNNNLGSIGNGDALESIGGALIFKGGGSLNMNTAVFPSLKSVGSFVHFSNNRGLKEISAAAFPALETVGKYMWFRENKLESIDFPAIKSVGEQVYIREHPVLFAVSFPTLAALGTNFFVDDCPSLARIDLPSVNTFPHHFDLSKVPSLETVVVAPGATARLLHVHGLPESFDTSQLPTHVRSSPHGHDEL